MQRVTTLEEIQQAALGKQSLSNLYNKNQMPAAFILSMQGRVILNMLNKGLYIYVTPKNKERNKYRKVHNYIAGRGGKDKCQKT